MTEENIEIKTAVQLQKPCAELIEKIRNKRAANGVIYSKNQIIGEAIVMLADKELAE